MGIVRAGGQSGEMESIIDEWHGENGISLTLLLVDQKTTTSHRRRTRSGFFCPQLLRSPSSLKALILCWTFFLLFTCPLLIGAEIEISSLDEIVYKPSVHEQGHALLLQRLIKVISKNRAAMNAAKNESTGSTVSVSVNSEEHSKYANTSTDDIRETLKKKIQEFKNIRKPSTESSFQSEIIEKTFSVSHTNTGCPHDDLYMSEADQCTYWKSFVFQYLFPMVLILAILGNALTLAVYRSRYLKSAATVLLLAVKAQANLAFACCLAMEMLHYFVAENSPFQDVYWKSRPYTLFLANYFDSLAVWCTLAIILETYICVSFPMSFRRWSKRRTIYMVIVCLMIGSGLLHVAYPITRDVERFPTCPPSHRYQMVIRDGWFYHHYERAYFFLHALAVISLPVLFMAIFSSLVGYNFNKKPLGQRFSERRRCVLRITIATTLCTLALQTPGLIVFAAAAVRGSTLEQNASLCTVNVVTNFLAILNSAAPFLVYLCLNETFRRLLCVQMGSRFVDWPFGGYCRPLYEDHLRRVATNEATEAEQSHCGLSPFSNQFFSSSQHRNSLFLSADQSADRENSTDQNRLSARPTKTSSISPTVDVKKHRNTTTMWDGSDCNGKPRETIRIIIEEAI